MEGVTAGVARGVPACRSMKRTVLALMVDGSRSTIFVMATALTGKPFSVLR